MTNIKNICVYASSSNNVDEVYYRDAQKLGQLIAQNNYDIVYGGSRLGLMYTCAEAVKKNGGRVIAVIPEKLSKLCGNPEDCDEYYVTAGMRERKAKLDELSDAVIAIAGGFGTLEEVSEMITQKQLGYSNKPTIILNTAGLYNHLISFFEDIINNRFAPEISKELYFVANTPEEAMEYIKTYKPARVKEKYKV